MTKDEKAELEVIDLQLCHKTKLKAEEKKIGFGHALKLVASENPSLMRRRAQILRKL
jgi:hypothetical protein